MLKSFDELLNRSSQILHAEFRGKCMLMSNGVKDFAESAHVAAGKGVLGVHAALAALGL